MTTHAPRLLALLSTALLVAAASASNVVASSESATAPVADAPACSLTGRAPADLPGWPVANAADSPILPVLMSSLVSVGPNRFLYNVLDPTYRQLAAPDVPSRIDFYAIERDANVPVGGAHASYLSSGLGRGLYRATVDFDCVGEWGAEVSIELEDGSIVSERLRFAVHELGDTPAIGAPAPLSDSLTAFTDEAAQRISTDKHPYPAAYDKTVAQTVTSGSPSLVFFATPAFCQTGFCGPTVELVKSVAMDYEGDVEFVNVEPYVLHVTENGLQPLLDEDGHLQPVQAALDYGIPVEPYLFVIDAEGDVFAKFEGIVGGDELRAAIEDALGRGPATG
jgi:hypothetical protein